jgi:hypothetical protein
MLRPECRACCMIGTSNIVCMKGKITVTGCLDVQQYHHQRQAWSQEAQDRLREVDRRVRRLKKQNLQVADAAARLDDVDLMIHPELCGEWRAAQSTTVAELKNQLQHAQLVCLLVFLLAAGPTSVDCIIVFSLPRIVGAELTSCLISPPLCCRLRQSTSRSS